jgi:hypothetical protein
LDLYQEILIALVEECTTTFKFLALSAGTFMTPYEEEESVSTFSRQNVQWFTRSGDIQMNAPFLNTTLSRL